MSPSGELSEAQLCDLLSEHGIQIDLSRSDGHSLVGRVVKTGEPFYMSRSDTGFYDEALIGEIKEHVRGLR